jgi:putative methionine-R-sulfoxide reductase with GAF domain
VVRGPPAHRVFSASDGLTGAALSAGATIRCDDVRSDPRYLTNQETTGPELVAPIIAGRDLVGTFDFESDRPHAFSDADRRLAEQLDTALKGSGTGGGTQIRPAPIAPEPPSPRVCRVAG